MRVKLTEKGIRFAETLEIPKEIREKFYSIFPKKTGEIEKVLLHYCICTHDATNWDEKMCVGVMLLPRTEAYIEAIQKDA